MKMSKVLRESDTPQITGTLIKFNFETKEFEGKCALGELSCKSGKPDLELSEIRQNVDVGKILDAYDIPLDMRDMLPLLTFNNSSGNVDVIYDIQSYLYSQIVFLNDTLRYTFKQIAEFLEVTYDL